MKKCAIPLDRRCVIAKWVNVHVIQVQCIDDARSHTSTHPSTHPHIYKFSGWLLFRIVASSIFARIFRHLRSSFDRFRFFFQAVFFSLVSLVFALSKGFLYLFLSLSTFFASPIASANQNEKKERIDKIENCYFIIQ